MAQLLERRFQAYLARLRLARKLIARRVTPLGRQRKPAPKNPPFPNRSENLAAKNSPPRRRRKA
jgi:hypothetical protein